MWSEPQVVETCSGLDGLHSIISRIVLDFGKAQHLHERGMYMPKRPRRPFFMPYQPPTGLSAQRPHASPVPGFAGFCSLALPSSTRSQRAFNIADRSPMARALYRRTVFPTMERSAGGSCASSRYTVYSDVRDGVLSTHGAAFVPGPAFEMSIQPPWRECEPLPCGSHMFGHDDCPCRMRVAGTTDVWRKKTGAACRAFGLRPAVLWTGRPWCGPSQGGRKACQEDPVPLSGLHP